MSGGGYPGLHGGVGDVAAPGPDPDRSCPGGGDRVPDAQEPPERTYTISGPESTPAGHVLGWTVYNQEGAELVRRSPFDFCEAWVIFTAERATLTGMAKRGHAIRHGLTARDYTRFPRAR